MGTGLPIIAHADDVDTVRTIFRLTSRDQWSDARDASMRGSVLTREIYEWMALQRPDSGLPFDRYRDFLEGYSDWPYARRIRANAERAFVADMSPAEVLAFYQNAVPVTARAMTAYVRALIATGREPEARETVNIWFQDAGLTPDEQTFIMSNLRSMMTRETLLIRLNRMITEQNYDHAKLLAGQMGVDYAVLARARIALARRDNGAAGLIANITPGLRNDPGLMFERLRALRRADRTDAMFAMFSQLPATFQPVDARAFWGEQQILAQRLIDDHRYAAAYQVATRNFDGDRFVQAQSEWMGGYIAFTYLRQPGRSFRHFETLYKIGLSPLTRARAAYWAAEASMDLKYPDVARAWYKMAAGYKSNFYGQIAARKLPNDVIAYRHGPPVASTDERAEFSRNSMVRAARLLHEAGQDGKAALFLNRMADLYAGKGGELRLVVDLALEMGMDSAAVKISREAATDGIDFSDYVFPVIKGLPNSGIEPALMYAIIRQESGFDVGAVSPAGAKGLMQLMPKTAKAIAKQEGHKHDNKWLTSQPNHNVKLGTAYLKDLIDNYGGSYAIAAAAYNAGPGRVSGWLEQYGDPRKGEVPLLEWIERIPVYETRNYVQRILEGTQVYRQKLAGHGNTPRDTMHLGVN